MADWNVFLEAYQTSGDPGDLRPVRPGLKTRASLKCVHDREFTLTNAGGITSLWIAASTTPATYAALLLQMLTSGGLVYLDFAESVAGGNLVFPLTDQCPLWLPSQVSGQNADAASGLITRIRGFNPNAAASRTIRMMMFA